MIKPYIYYIPSMRLLLLLLLPLTTLGQSVDSWDVVRDGYYKIVVDGDTLQDNFTRYDTALKFAYDYAETNAGGKPISIVSPDFRFDYEYGESIDHPYLSNVDWTYIADSTGWKLRLTGESIAEEIVWKWKCVGTNDVQYGSLTIVLQDPGFDHTKSFYCDQILTWDLTARTDTMELQPRKYFIDVALIQSLQ